MNSQAFSAQAKFKQLVREQFKIELYNLSELDSYRLLNLEVWSQRYKVSWGIILGILIPYYQKRIKLRKRTTGLGIKIATLTGEFSRCLLVDVLAEFYPNNENLSEWQWQRLLDIMAARSGEDKRPRAKQLQDFETIEEYNAYYDRRIKRERKELDDIQSDPKNRVRKYRDSPFV